MPSRQVVIDNMMTVPFNAECCRAFASLSAQVLVKRQQDLNFWAFLEDQENRRPVHLLVRATGRWAVSVHRISSR